jgi:uncharacterized delta-60 repeat protein
MKFALRAWVLASLALVACDDGGGAGGGGADAQAAADAAGRLDAGADAAARDAAGLDGALPDAAVHDAAVPDAALPDAALPDAALPDAAHGDAGLDAAGADATASDAGHADAAAADAGHADASTDAEATDAAPDAACPDADGDGVCDDADVCPGRDDHADGDGDGYACADDCDDDADAVHPDAMELCNGADDDCDGQADEDLDLGGPCMALGACGAGVRECAPGGLVRCSTGPGGSADRSAAEVCNGADDDCDGTADDGLDAPPASLQAGVCAGAVQTCGGNAGWQDPDFTAIAGYEADEASCDGRDNDCDGQVDENLQGPPAARQDGVCAGARQVCGPGGFQEPDYAAIAGYEADEATCDGVDNDCDGRVDEGLVAPPASRQAGVCAGAVQVCAGAAGWVDPDFGAQFEADETRCDGLDNDCDGSVDEAQGVGTPCTGTGACGAGVVECAAIDAGRCSTDPGGSADQSAPETCDGTDEDCDGQVDEEAGCLPPGSPDPAFGGTGFVIPGFAAEDDAEAVALLPDGRIVIAGSARPAADHDLLVARFDEAGVADATFGAGGVVIRDVSGGTDRGYGLALDAASGAVYVAGHSGAPGANVSPALAAFDTAGQPLAGFGAGGVHVEAGLGTGTFRRVALTADGLIAGGDVRSGGPWARLLAGYDPAGASNPAFGDHGFFVAPHATPQHGGAFALAGDTLAVTGYAERGGDDDGLLARADAAGHLQSDVAYDATGNGDSADRFFAVAADGDGWIAVGETVLPAPARDMLVARFGADGTLDRTFGTGGRVQIDFGGDTDTAYAVAVQPDGRVLVAGRARVGGVDRAALARLDAAGAPDATFGPHGRRTFTLDPTHDAAITDVALRPDLRVVVVGHVATDAGSHAFLGRLFR